jgi:hypothetical protein
LLLEPCGKPLGNGEAVAGCGTTDGSQQARRVAHENGEQAQQDADRQCDQDAGAIEVAGVLSALVWAPIHVFPGVLAGMAISLAGPHASKVILFILGALILGSIAWHLLKGQSQVRLGASASEQGSEVAPPKSESHTRSRLVHEPRSEPQRPQPTAENHPRRKVDRRNGVQCP